METQIREMPSQQLLERYLAGAFGEKRDVRPTSIQISAFKARVDGWGPVPEIKKMPTKELLEKYLGNERICFRPDMGIFESY